MIRIIEKYMQHHVCYRNLIEPQTIKIQCLYFIMNKKNDHYIVILNFKK